MKTSIYGLLFSLFLVFSSGLATAQEAVHQPTNEEIEQAIKDYPFVKDLLMEVQELRSVEVTRFCNSNYNCRPGEHCLNNRCVPASGGTRCYADSQCYPYKCRAGRCLNP